MSSVFSGESIIYFRKSKQHFFFWDHNIISVTMNSSTYKINNNSDVKFSLIQQWFTISTSSSPRLSTDTSVSPEMEKLTITFRITETRPPKNQCEQTSPFWMHSYTFRSGKASVNYSLHGLPHHHRCQVVVVVFLTLNFFFTFTAYVGSEAVNLNFFVGSGTSPKLFSISFRF